MTPTNKLRFVNGKETFETGHVTSDGHRFLGVRYVRVLQQWWEPEQNIIDRVTGKTQGEWRDIPTETEDFTQNKTSG
jgi:hypothetical protein